MSTADGTQPDQPSLAAPTPMPPADASTPRPPAFAVVVPQSGLPAFASVGDTRESQTPYPYVTASPGGTSSRSGTRAWIIVLSLAALALLGLAGYLWVVNAQWQDQNTELRDQATSLQTNLDDAATQMEQLQSTLDKSNTDLTGATDKITDLADTSANARDQAAFLSEIADSFDQCVDAQASHISHLENASRYTASSLAAEGRDVEEYCDNVNSTYSDFLKSLDEE